MYEVSEFDPCMPAKHIAKIGDEGVYEQNGKSWYYDAATNRSCEVPTQSTFIGHRLSDQDYIELGRNKLD